MIRELLDTVAGLESAELHVVFLALLSLSAALVGLSTIGVLVRRAHGGPLARGLALVAIGVTTLAMVVATACVDLGAGEAAARYEAWLLTMIGTMAAIGAMTGATAAAARTATVMAGVQLLTSLGLMVYLLLLGSVVEGVDASWELSRLSEFGIFATCGFLLLLAAGFVSSRRQGWLSVGLFSACGAAGLVTLAQGFANHPDPGLSVALAALGPVILAGLWLAWLRYRRTSKAPGEFWRWLRGVGDRLGEHPALHGVVFAAPLLLASAALLFGGSGSAREAGRIDLGGLSITPGLVTPFLFALALGLLVGQEKGRWRGWGGILLTLAMAGLLFAQKEVGNIAVIFLVASWIYLVARGTWLHLTAGGLLAAAGVVAAYQLAPVFSFIPFTFRERIHLWLGGAELLQRGGHIVTATWVNYGLGGFWGLGIDEVPGINLTRMVIAIHTDFPLIVLGLFGGFTLLSVYVVGFTALAVLLLDTIRSLNFEGDMRRARRQAPILAGLLAVPVGSTVINLAGAITQLAPFTGVPVMLVSYSSFFLTGTFTILALFVLAGNRDAIRNELRDEAEARAREEAPPPRLDFGVSAPTPTPPPAEEAPPPIQPPSPHASSWFKRHFGRARLTLLGNRLRRRLRFSRIDGGVLVLIAALVLLAFTFVETLYARYTDRTRYFGHPRLQHELRVEPVVDQPGRFTVEGAPEPALLGPLEDRERILLDGVLMEYRDAALHVVGACVSPERAADPGLAIGFAGMLDAPALPVVEPAIEPALDRFALRATANDIVLPFGDITLRHLAVRRVGDGMYHAQARSDAATFRLLDTEGRPLPGFTDYLRAGQAIEIGTARVRRFVLEERDRLVCLRMTSGAIFQYNLSHDGPTLIGSMALLRNQIGGRTADLLFAEDVKAAAEAGILFADGPAGPLRTIPCTAQDRDRWDEATRRRFFKVFDILNVKRDDGSTAEVLAWSRPFYRGGDRRFSGDRELSAFVIDGQRVLGLADSFRFSQLLPIVYDPADPERNGLLLDRHERPVSQLVPAENKVINTVEGATPLIGYDFRSSGIRDGLLRNFTLLLRGVEPLPDVHRDLEDRLDATRRGPFGHDVILTLDRSVQREAFLILEDELHKLDKKEPDTLHHASAVILGPRNEVIAAVQMPDPGVLHDLDAVKAWKDAQREAPLDAPALDAFHRRTTLGSTIKLLTVIAAFRDKEGALLRHGDEWYLDARDDARNSNGKPGFFVDHCSVASWKGQAIAPIRNFGGGCYGDVVPIRELLVRSINTAAAYLGMNVGKERFAAFLEQIGVLRPIDLLPTEMHDFGPFGHLVSRYPKDAATALPVNLAAIPPGEPWTLSLTGRLPLSGLSDYSVLDTALGASVIARDGLYYPPTLVTGVRSRRNGEATFFAPASSTRVISEEDARFLKGVMRDTVLRGTAGGYKRGLPKEVWTETGGKTGTGETTVPIDPRARYSLDNKPKTRDNKAFVAVWPLSSPQPWVVVVVFEQVSHLDTGVAIRTARRMMEAVRTSLQP